MLATSLKITVTAVAVLALGCGDDGGGGMVDATVELDAPLDAALLGQCGVAVGHADFEGQPVVFSRPDGTLIGTAAVASGQARRDDCVDNTIITLTKPGPSWELVSIAAVGRDVTVEWFQLDPSASETVVTANAEGAPAAASYVVANGCGDEVATPGVAAAAMPVNALCYGRNAGDFDVLAAALDGDGEALSFSYRADIAPTPPTTAVDMAAAPAADWSVTVLRGLVTVNGYDTVTGEATVTAEQVVDGVTLWEDGGLDDAALAGGATTFFATFLPADLREQTVLSSRVAASMTGPITVQRSYMQEDAPRVVDFASHLARVSTPIFTKEDPARPIARWVYEGDLSATDGAFVRASWDDGGGEAHGWTILTPPTLEFQLPELPEELSDYRPPPEALFEGALTIVFAEDWRGYDEVLTDGQVLPGLVLYLGQLSLTGPPGEGRTDLSVSLFAGGGGGVIML